MHKRNYPGNLNLGPCQRIDSFKNALETSRRKSLQWQKVVATILEEILDGREGRIRGRGAGNLKTWQLTDLKENALLNVKRKQKFYKEN